MVSNSIAVAPAVPLGYALGGVLERDDLQRRGLLYANALESLGGYVLCLGVTMGVKSLVQRPRPWVAYAGDLTCLQSVRSYSFPSGHTSSVFAMATSVALMQPQWYVVVPAYMWAGAVAFSRLYVGAHYPTDVIAGAAVGVGCALLAHAVRGCLFRGQQETPPPDMVLLPLTFRF